MKVVLSAFFLSLVLLFPVVSSAALVSCDGVNCRFCDLMELGSNIIEWLIIVMVSIIAIVFMAGGLKMVTSGGDTSAVSKAKEMMTNAVIGFVILLLAWLIVDTVFKVLLRTTGEYKLGPWNEIQCENIPAFTGNAGNTGSQGGGQTGGVVAGGSCTPATLGACGTDSLTSTFGSAAAQASQICIAESGGNAGSLSKTDRLRATNEVFSVGLFQINLTVHELRGCGPGGATLKCHEAFDGRNYNARIINRALYDQCIEAGVNKDCNARNAQRIYTEANNTWNDWSTAAKCGLRV